MSGSGAAAASSASVEGGGGAGGGRGGSEASDLGVAGVEGGSLASALSSAVRELRKARGQVRFLSGGLLAALSERRRLVSALTDGEPLALGPSLSEEQWVSLEQEVYALRATLAGAAVDKGPGEAVETGKTHEAGSWAFPGAPLALVNLVRGEEADVTSLVSAEEREVVVREAEEAAVLAMQRRAKVEALIAAEGGRAVGGGAVGAGGVGVKRARDAETGADASVPPRPADPKSAREIFNDETAQALATSMADLGPKAVGKEVAKRWELLSEEERATYEQKAELQFKRLQEWTQAHGDAAPSAAKVPRRESQRAKS